MDELDHITAAYHRIIESHAVPFDGKLADGEWHLTLFWLPSFKPESIIDIDSRRGETLIHRAVFLESVWSKVWEASQKRGELATFSVHRACERLAPETPIHRVVRDEAIFRLSDGTAMGCDGETVVLVFTFADGVFRRECWEPRQTGNRVWQQVLDAVDEAVRVLPPQCL